MEKRWYTVREALALVNISRQTLYNYLSNGLVPDARKLRGTTWRISQSDIDKINAGEIMADGIYSKIGIAK